MIMKMTRVAGLVSALALAGCGADSPFADPAIDHAKQVVSEQLVDSASARFENVVTQKTAMATETTLRPIQPGEEAVCGWVNAKNAMGAYTGPQWFLVKQGTTTFYEDDPEWMGAFATCILRSDDEKARDRFSREADRQLQAHNDAVAALNGK